MRNWMHYVAERLARSRLPPELQRDVVAEIAAHLEDCEEDLRKEGLSDPEARTLAQVSNWIAFCRDIRRAKEDSMAVVRRILMPGAAAVVVALAALKLWVYLLISPQPCGPDATCITVSADGPAYLPWLATLPLAGALAAVLARRGGAQPRQRLLAAMFPAFYLAAEMFVMGLLDGFFWRIPIYWVLIPAIAAAVGAWPFLDGRHGKTPTRHSLTQRTENALPFSPSLWRLRASPPLPKL
jgi:hypothetical protein